MIFTVLHYFQSVSGCVSVFLCIHSLAFSLHSPGFGCRAALQSLSRLTTTRHRCIMDAFDIVPTLHFEEPALKISGEEQIRVMDEYIVPNSVGFMEPGRTFLLILDNAPSHACRLPCEHCKVVLHGTVEFQPPCSPDLSPLDFFRGQAAVGCSRHGSAGERFALPPKAVFSSSTEQ